jgi:hypothetical protein
MSGAFCWRSRIGRADPARSADFTLEDVGEREWECFAGFYAHGWTSHAAGDKWADRSGSRPTGDVEIGELAEPVGAAHRAKGGRSVLGRSGKPWARHSLMNLRDAAACSKTRSSGAGGLAASAFLAATSLGSGNQDRTWGFMVVKVNDPTARAKHRIWPRDVTT